MEATKWLKPSVMRVTKLVKRECAGRNASEAEQTLKRSMRSKVHRIISTV